MYSLVEQILIEEYSAVCAVGDELIWQNKEGVLCLSPFSDLMNVQHLHEEDDSITNIRLINNEYILAIKGSEEGVIINKVKGGLMDLGSLKIFKFKLNAPVIDNRFLILKEIKSSNHGFFDVVDKKIMWVSKNSGAMMYSYENKLFLNHFELVKNNGSSHLKKGVKCIDTLNGELIWFFDTSNLRGLDNPDKLEGQVKQIIGVYDNMLFVWAEPSILMGIDVESGVLMWKIDSFNDLLPFKVRLRPVFHIDYVAAKILTFASGFVFEIDILTQKFNLIKDFSSLRDGGGRNFEWHAQFSHLSNQQLFFIGTKNRFRAFPDTVGIYSMGKNKVVWHKTLDLDKNHLHRGVTICGEYLLIRDNKGTLFIYKKD